MTIAMEGQGQLLTPYEAEHKIESLANFGIEMVGSSKYMQQVRTVEELNLQAHHNAMNQSDEFVSDLLVTLDKIPTLIHELLVVEVWKIKVFPNDSLQDQFSSSSLSVPVYLILQHELQLINLLECTLFHKEACETTSGDILVELVDYCYRKLVYLNTEARDHVENTNLERNVDVKDLLNTTAKQDLQKKVRKVLSSLSLSPSLSRFLSLPNKVGNGMLFSFQLLQCSS